MKNPSPHLIVKRELWIHVTFPTSSNSTEIKKAAQSFKIMVSFIKGVFNRNFRRPALSLYTNFVLTYSGGTDAYPGVPFRIALREHTQFISLSFSLLIVWLLTHRYLYLSPVPIWLTDANLSPFNYAVNFDCFMKLMKPVISLPIDNIKLMFGTEPIIFDQWRRHSSFFWVLGVWFFSLFFYTYQVLLAARTVRSELWNSTIKVLKNTKFLKLRYSTKCARRG